MFNQITHNFKYGDKEVKIETGKIAKQADASVVVTMGKTVVLATVVVGKEPSSSGFFPLAVFYQEKRYAAGQIPGGYIKRETRPKDRETLISRLIDRPIRPLFPKGFVYEIQLVLTVLSADIDIESDIVAMIAASSAISISGLPFLGPIGATKVGLDAENNYILNPSITQLKESRLDMVVAGTSDAVIMVESQASELSEEIMAGAVVYAHGQMQIVINAINELKAKVSIPTRTWVIEEVNETLLVKIKEDFIASIAESYKIKDKKSRLHKLNLLKNDICETLLENEEGKFSKKDILDAFSQIEKNYVRDLVLKDKIRIDGRSPEDIRSISTEISLLPAVHGSALFTRGETQALVVVTLGFPKQGEMIEDLHANARNLFIFNYNFPPFCVGEIGMIGSPKRREIGHGNLASRSIKFFLPKEEDFPYCIRVVSEITESNGSSSMASVCGASLALMDAGVPIKKPVSGIAMGLIKKNDDYVVLSDIMGDEDHLGDMDFKVAGSADGITALQMDIKIDGITIEIIKVALEQARIGRNHILQKMNETIDSAKKTISVNAPRIFKHKIPVDKIRDLIGKGGSNIQKITKETGVEIDIVDDSGILNIYAVEEKALNLALTAIDNSVSDSGGLEIGSVYPGTVVKIMDFGAFVSLPNGKEGLVHISQIAEGFVKSVDEFLSEGDKIKVKLLAVESGGKRLKLCYKEVKQD